MIASFGILFANTAPNRDHAGRLLGQGCSRSRLKTRAVTGCISEQGLSAGASTVVAVLPFGLMA